MIIKEQEVTERMSSPLNLLNRLKEATSRSSNHSIVSIPPTASDVMKDIDEKLAFGGLKSKASTIMMKAMNELEVKISETTKVSDLARIAGEMNKIITAEDADKSDENRPQFHVYAPQFNQENHYETIYARE